MDYYQMTAPCGLDCFNCAFFLAHEDQEAMKQVEQWSEELNIPVKTMLCHGCRSHNGQIPLQKHLFGEAHRGSHDSHSTASNTAPD
jgi:3-methyladenine DNA glycosylase AlkC